MAERITATQRRNWRTKNICDKKTCSRTNQKWNQITKNMPRRYTTVRTKKYAVRRWVVSGIASNSRIQDVLEMKVKNKDKRKRVSKWFKMTVKNKELCFLKTSDSENQNEWNRRRLKYHVRRKTPSQFDANILWRKAPHTQRNLQRHRQLHKCKLQVTGILQHCVYPLWSPSLSRGKSS